jgi:hypothetical protein
VRSKDTHVTPLAARHKGGQGVVVTGLKKGNFGMPGGRVRPASYRVSLGTMTKLPAPEQWMLCKLSEEETAELIEQNIDYVDEDWR